MQSRIISFHSVRRGSGKTTIVANLAALLVSKGRRVVVVETDFLYPSLQMFFKLPDWKISHTLNDYVLNQCSIEQTLYEAPLPAAANSGGKLYLAPACICLPDAYEKLRPAYTFERLQEGLNQIMKTMQPDAIFVDSMAGMQTEALLSVASSNSLVMILQADTHYFQDTAVAIELAHKLKVPEVFLIMNNTPASIDLARARDQMEQIYQCKVLPILPQSIDIAALAGAGLLVFEKPHAPILEYFQEILAALLPG